MKRIITFVLMITLSITTVFTASSVNAISIDSTTYEHLTADDYIMIQEQFIEEACNYVIVTEDGLLELNPPKDIINKIESDEYNSYQEGIGKINQMIKAGKLAVTENGTIYEPTDDDLVVQGGNVDKVTWHWWGVRRYANHDNAAYMAYKMGNASSYFGYGCAVSGILAIVVPSTTAKVIAGGAVVGTTFGWSYFSHFANKINYYNKSRGVIIDLTWILVFGVRSQ